ncbi:MAG: outer membrane protein assembly factor BamC [Sulfuricella sp.]|nr:outer membrane protein assembly factor BamC [Sulfuricella sp.]
MNGAKFISGIILAAATLALTGCGSFSILESKKIDYKSAGKLPALEVPPDLTSLSSDDRFTVPDVTPQGSATYSSYSKDRSAQPQSGSAGLLPSVDKVRVERSGSQRWLVVNANPEQAWSVVREFWQEMGFIVKQEVPEAGVMETDWAENRANIPQDMIRNLLGKALDSLYSTAERDKFRTRLERVQGGTEIFVSHRGMIEVYEGSSTGSGNGRTVWQPRPADPELEAEMLGRLMVRFGVDEVRAKSLVAADGVRERAKITRAQEGAGSLAIVDPFDRAWRRVGLALDRVGFTVEDRDRSKGMYFVRYVDPETESGKDDKGFFSKLAFWKSGKGVNKNEQFRIQVSENADGCVVRVLNKDNVPEKSETSDRILTLLHEQLK